MERKRGERKKGKRKDGETSVKPIKFKPLNCGCFHDIHRYLVCIKWNTVSTI